MVSGIYAIVNLKNNRKYIGSAKDLQRRWNEHKQKLRRGKHHNFHLQRAWNACGEENFGFLVYEFVDIPDLQKVEQRYLDTERGKYNIARSTTWDGHHLKDKIKTASELLDLRTRSKENKTTCKHNTIN